MLSLANLSPQKGAKKDRKRLGRGPGTGLGKTSGRGHKGYGARAGAKRRFGDEGGQTPVLSRIPKRGFSNALFRKVYQEVNVASLDRFDDGTRVDAAAMEAARLIEDAAKPVKVLGKGEITKKLTVVADRFSGSASEKIQAAGGTTEEA